MNNETKKVVKNILYYVSVIIAIFILTTTLLSLLTDTSWRYFKMLDFPRIQYFVFGGIVLLLFIWITEKWRWYDYLFAGMLAASMLFQGTYLINYTPLISKAVPDAITEAEGLKLLVYNLYDKNDKYDEALAMLDKSDADILITLETTPKWEEKLSPLRQQYPYTTETINKVAYGMTVYSKFPMEDLEKFYLHNDKVPSYKFKVSPPNMVQTQIYSLHPPPPKHFKEYPDNEGQQEKALIMIGDRIEREDIPTIIIGDLNDVAWGDTDRLMQANGRLKDVRVGRSFYNSFNAHNFLMRWPLDHVFVTKHFSLKKLELLDNAGSDHYPVVAEITQKKEYITVK